MKKTTKKQPLKGKRIPKSLENCKRAKKTREKQRLTSPTVSASKKLQAINLTEDDCKPYSLKEITSIIDLVAPPNTTGKGRQPIFRTNTFPMKPNGGNEHTFKPVQVIKVLVAYMTTTNNINKCCKMFGVSEMILRTRLMRSYPEVRKLWELSLTHKPQAYGDKAQEIIMGEIPEEYFEETKFGKRLSSSGVQHLNNQTQFNLKMAQITERRAFNEKTELKIDFEIQKKADPIDIEEYKKVSLEDLASLL